MTEKSLSFYTVSDLKQIFGIGRNKAYNMAHDASITKVRIGKAYLFPKREMDAWIEQHKYM